MKKILVLFLIYSLNLFGELIVENIKFESGITIYGQVGFVDLTYTEDTEKNTYKMEIKTTSTGIVKFLTDNRIDYFISEGTIENGVYKPLTFTKKTLKTDSEKKTTYSFDYKFNTVVKNVEKSEYETQSDFDPYQMKYIETKKLVVHRDVQEIKMYPNDYLSLYLNLRKGNIKKGVVSYVDKKESDTLILVNNELIEVHKNDGDDKYEIAVHYDGDARFFKKVESIGVAFYGDAYIEKIDPSTEQNSSVLRSKNSKS